MQEFGLVKSLNIPLRPGTDRLKTYYDTVELVQNTAEYNFFSSNPSRDRANNNYRRNPFPGGKDRAIVALGFHLTKPVWTADGQAIANALAHTAVQATIDQDDTTVLEESLSRYVYPEDVHTAYDGSASTTTTTVTFGQSGLVMLNQQFSMPEGATFDVKLHLDDASSLPAADNGLDVQCSLQVAEGPDIIDVIQAANERQRAQLMQ